MHPPITGNSWNDTKSTIHSATIDIANNSMMKAGNETNDSSGITVTVSCDGMWQKRGFSSKNGVATVLSVSNQGPATVLDVHTMSNFCDTCITRKKKYTKEVFDDWYEHYTH